jgi:hypothetical protein
MNVDGQAGNDFDASKISFIGHSLGGIVGTGLLAYSNSNQFIAAATNTPLKPIIQSGSLVNASGGIIGLLLNSKKLSPPIFAGLSAAFKAEQTSVHFKSTLQKYAFAAQAVIDSADPINIARIRQTVPTLTIENKDDPYISNAIASSPLSGTEPFAKILSLVTTKGESNTPIKGQRFFTKLNVGNHASLLRPDEATFEMQSQIISFILSGGQSITIDNPDLLMP